MEQVNVQRKVVNVLMQLNVYLTQENKIVVRGNIEDPMVAYGLLKCGEKELDRYYAEKGKESPIVLAQAEVPAQLVPSLVGG